jgi:hypothetical protein
MRFKIFFKEKHIVIELSISIIGTYKGDPIQYEMAYSENEGSAKLSYVANKN